MTYTGVLVLTYRTKLCKDKHQLNDLLSYCREKDAGVGAGFHFLLYHIVLCRKLKMFCKEICIF